LNKVSVTGIGMTTCGKHEVSLKTLLMEACLQALREADFPRIDAVHIGNFMTVFQ
jgi:acetyl-CoA C-acetyltransferase